MAIRPLASRLRKQVSADAQQEVPFFSLQREMHHLFDDCFQGGGGDIAPFRNMEESLSSYTPRIDVVENNQEVRISAELPGMDEKDVQVTLSGDQLIIRGEKKVEREDKGENYYRVERSYGSFHRAVPLPAEINPDKAEAIFKKSVLTIALPKTLKHSDKQRRSP